MTGERITWTLEEIRKFDRLADDTGSRDQMVRIKARMDQANFIKEHGKAKCDAMWAHLQAGGKVEARP